MKAKATGMARAIDPLGRIVIPKEIRSALDWQTGEPLAIYTEGDRVILRKESSACIFCGKTEHTETFGGKQICSKCLAQIKKL